MPQLSFKIFDTDEIPMSMFCRVAITTTEYHDYKKMMPWINDLKGLKETSPMTTSFKIYPNDIEETKNVLIENGYKDETDPKVYLNNQYYSSSGEEL